MVAMKVAGLVFSPIIAVLTGLLLTGASRKMVARVEWRYGPPLLQPFIDMVKLFFQRAPSHGEVFDYGLVISLSGSIVLLLFLPIGHLCPLGGGGGLLVIIYLMLIPPLGIATSGGEGANPYISIGVSRKLMLGLGYEVTLILVLLSVMSEYNTISILKVVQAQSESGWSLFSWPLVIPGIAYLLIMPAILGVKPFDVASAPQEISSGSHAEYGGKYLAFVTVGGGLSEFIGVALFVNLFLGGPSLPGAFTFPAGALGVFLGVILFLTKVAFVFSLNVMVSALFPRLRVEGAVKYLWSWPALIGLIGTIVVWAL